MRGLKHVVLAAAFTGCAFAGGPGGQPPSPPAEPPAEAPTGPTGHDPWKTALLYLPNRVMDAGDMVRAGVDLGPGIGFDARVTKFAQLGLLSRTSIGAGFQTFRRIPVHMSVENYAGIGPISVSPSVGQSWYKAPFDVRLEVHAFFAGAHAAVDMDEVVDFLAGLALQDLSKDDW